MEKNGFGVPARPILAGLAVAALCVALAPARAEDERGPREIRRAEARVGTARDLPAERPGPAERFGPRDGVPALPAKPPTEACEAIADQGERIACKAEKTNAEIGNVVETLTSPDDDLLTERQKAFLRNAHERSERERERTGPDGFRQFAKRRDAGCLVKEFDDPTGNDPDDDGNNDGICDRGELCAENDLDQIGDNDGKCETWKQGHGKPVREACVEICEAEAVEADDASYDADAGLDAEGAFDDGAVMLARMNVELESARLAAARRMPVLAGTDGDACANLLVDDRQFPYPLLQSAQGVANVLKGVHDGCTDVSRQSSAGFNWSAGCVKSAIAMNAVQLVEDAFELQDDSVTGSRIDATTSCLELMSDEVQANNDEVDAIAQAIDEAEEEIGAQLDELMLLLQTPPGRRPDYPLGTAEKP